MTQLLSIELAAIPEGYPADSPACYVSSGGGRDQFDMEPLASSSRRFYDEIWKQSWLVLHEIGPMTRTRYRLITGLLRGRLSPGQTLLDAGCGSGGLLARIRTEFPGVRLFAAEYSPEALRALPQGLCEQVFSGSLEDPTLLDGHRFDVILCSEVLEHLSDPRAAVVAIRAALAPGGVVVITVPHRQDYWGRQDEFAGHQRRFERAELEDLVRSADLQPVETRVWGFPFSYFYLKLIDRHSPTELAGKSTGGLAKVASSILYELFKLDDHVSSVRGFQLLLVAERRTAASAAG